MLWGCLLLCCLIVCLVDATSSGLPEIRLLLPLLRLMTCVALFFFGLHSVQAVVLPALNGECSIVRCRRLWVLVSGLLIARVGGESLSSSPRLPVVSCWLALDVEVSCRGWLALVVDVSCRRCLRFYFVLLLVARRCLGLSPPRLVFPIAFVCSRLHPRCCRLLLKLSGQA